VLTCGLNGCLDALPPGSGDPLAIEDGQRHRISPPVTGRPTLSRAPSSAPWPTVVSSPR
jgi:hypothetical protein